MVQLVQLLETEDRKSHSMSTEEVTAEQESFVSRGELHGQAKLTEERVKAIRARYKNRKREKCSMQSLATEFDVSKPQIARILHREQWAHI